MITERLEPKRVRLADRVEELKVEWKRLWKERLDDRVRAEGIAKDDYSSLFVEKGTVIFATRDFKQLSFKGVLEEQGIGEVYKFVSPPPKIGGWGKFIRNSIAPRGSADRRGRVRQTKCFVGEDKKPQQLKNGGRGWLNV